MSARYGRVALVAYALCLLMVLVTAWSFAYVIWDVWGSRL